jgi:hypothetical protein
MEQDPRGWPDDMIAVFAALGRAIGEQQLRPESIARLPQGSGAIVEGHVVKITHRAGRELGEKRGRYTIEIRGARWLDGGEWTFLSGHLEGLARGAKATAS